ncbi:MAG TPA: class I SAM-dependent methyltransferase [Acidimicrobiales bacterium]|nr:class I SAM-dependent methyltransferase [Acidimicrobiales bacterium]
MAEVEDKQPLALQHLDAEEKARRSGSFGAVASAYQRYRPGPPEAAVDWYLPRRVQTVVDLGAGTGALTRLLVGRAVQVVAVEPDDRMRAVLAGGLPDVEALAGTGEQLPVGDGSADAVLASSSWHWMDVEATLREVRRVLKPKGILGALWSGPDPDGSFVNQARALVSENARSTGEGMSSFLKDATRPNSRLDIPSGFGFGEPEHETFCWMMSLTADELIGLLATFSWVINLNADEREALFAQARRLLEEFLGVEGDVTVGVDFRCDAWRARLDG